LCAGLAVTCGAFGAIAVANADSIEAAQPARGATYYGFEGVLRDFDVLPRAPDGIDGYERPLTAFLRVSADGRRLTGSGPGSRVRFRTECGRKRRKFVRRTIDLARTRPLKVKRDGSFRLVKKRGRLRFRLRGRFVSSGAARITYRASLPRCRSARRRVALRRDGQPGFSGCRSQSATDVLSSQEARIFWQRRLRRERFQQRVYFLRYAYGCLYGTNKRFRLGLDDFGDSGQGGFVDLFQLAGPFTAFRAGCTTEGCVGSVYVVDLRDGRSVREISRLSEQDDGQATDIALKENSSVAWISRNRSGGHEVTAIDSSGRRRLDLGSDIRPESLSLTGSTLTWRRGGVTRSAVLD
jgi:hypothetical protein